MTLSLSTPEPQRVNIQTYTLKLVNSTFLQLNLNTVTNSKDLAMLSRYIGLHEKPCEEHHVVFLNSRKEIVGMQMISMGPLGETVFPLRNVFTGALLANAHSIAILQNHPSGDAAPTAIDQDRAEEIKHVGELLGIGLHDYVIVTYLGKYCSMNREE